MRSSIFFFKDFEMKKKKKKINLKRIINKLLI
jgi:hypothetical protein